MDEYLCATGVSQLAISETQKYGHVTYFFNGNRSGKFDDKLDTYVEIRSDVVPFEQRPWMKCAEITDKVIEAIESGAYRMIRRALCRRPYERGRLAPSAHHCRQVRNEPGSH